MAAPDADPVPGGLGDAELVRACLDGRPAAFDVIVQRHRRAVYQLCYRFVSNHEDASDLTQEVFLRAFRALQGFRGQASFATWLYRIGVNVCLNRAAAKRPASEPIDSRSHVDLRAESPADRMLRAERDARVREAVAQLPAKQRAALVLRVYQEMTHQEIASALGTSVGAAKANVFHALRNLKRLLGKERF
jgi:RNA polymerase sigma-70 factor (ECF subfamily)